MAMALGNVDASPDHHEHLAAQREAAELIWKHQNPSAAYRLQPQSEKVLVPSEPLQNMPVDPAQIADDDDDTTIILPSAQRSPERSPSKGLSSRTSRSRLSTKRRSITSLRNVSSTIKKAVFPNSKDQIWEDKTSPTKASPEKTVSASGEAPTHIRRNPFARAQAVKENQKENQKAGFDRADVIKSLKSINTDREAQRWNPTYTSNISPALSPPIKSPSEHEEDPMDREVRYKDGVEVRGDDIRAATSMFRKDRSRRLPSPTVVSDDPTRPIVSFDANWQPPEEPEREEESLAMSAVQPSSQRATSSEAHVEPRLVRKTSSTPSENLAASPTRSDVGSFSDRMMHITPTGQMWRPVSPSEEYGHEPVSPRMASPRQPMPSRSSTMPDSGRRHEPGARQPEDRVVRKVPSRSQTNPEPHSMDARSRSVEPYTEPAGPRSRPSRPELRHQASMREAPSRRPYPSPSREAFSGPAEDERTEMPPPSQRPNFSRPKPSRQALPKSGDSGYSSGRPVSPGAPYDSGDYGYQDQRSAPRRPSRQEMPPSIEISEPSADPRPRKAQHSNVPSLQFSEPDEPAAAPARPSRRHADAPSVQVSQPEESFAAPARHSHRHANAPSVQVSEPDEPVTAPARHSHGHANAPSVQISEPSAVEEPVSRATSRQASRRRRDAAESSRPEPHEHMRHAEHARSADRWAPAGRKNSALCAQCALPISGRIVTAAGTRFHPECFSCYHCREALECVAFYPEPTAKREERLERMQRRAEGEDVAPPEGVPFEEDNDDALRFYCHLDYHEFFSPRCKSCKTPIEGEIIVACGAEWHVGHFFCAECGDPFSPSVPFVEKDGYAWCVNCHTNRSSTRCKKCRKPVTDMVLKALGADWHDECFRCFVSLPFLLLLRIMLTCYVNRSAIPLLRTASSSCADTARIRCARNARCAD